MQIWCTKLQKNLSKIGRTDKPEKETQEGKYKNPKGQKFKSCEIVKSNNRIIKKSQSSNMQKL